MRNRVLFLTIGLAIIALLAGCDGGDGSYWRCQINNSAPPGREPERYAQCAAKPNNPVKRVLISAKSALGSNIVSSEFALTQTEQMEASELFGNASFNPKLISKFPGYGGHEGADFLVLFQESHGRQRPVYIHLNQVEPMYGPEVAAWVKDRLPEIAKRHAAEEAKKPKLTEEQEYKIMEDGMIKAGKWHKDANGKLVTSPPPKGERP